MFGLAFSLIAVVHLQIDKFQTENYLAQNFIEKETLLDQERFFYQDNKYDTHDFILKQEKLYAIYVFDWLTFSCKQLTKSIESGLSYFLEWIF